jgi:beta-glucosidase
LLEAARLACRYDQHKVTPAFPFVGCALAEHATFARAPPRASPPDWNAARGQGHGLTYSTFKLSNLKVSTPGAGSSVHTVTVDVQNTGDVPATETPQLYLGFPSSSDAFEPVQQLKGFSKIALAPGKSASVSFELTSREISTWDTTARAWSVSRGVFTVSVGTSSRDQGALSATFKV